MKRTTNASLALSAAQLLTKVIDFLLILLLARVLMPEDFALIAISMIFVQITETVLEFPITQVLVRSPRVTRNMLHTAFALSCLRSSLAVLVILVLTPVSVAIFNEPRLYAIMPVLALAPAMRGLVNPKMVMFTRQLNFYPSAIMGVISRALTASIAFPFAIVTESYWALVMMTIVSPTILVILSYGYLPYWPKLSLKSWGIFANMMGWATVASILGAAHWQVKVFVLAQFAPRTTTGNYSLAGNVNGVAQHAIVTPVVSPLISAFSLLRKRRSLEDGYLLSSRGLYTAAGPIFVIFAVLSGPLVLLLFGAKWTEAPLLLTVLALSALLSLAVRPSTSIAYAEDRTIYLAIAGAINFLPFAFMLWFGFAWYGLNGFLVAHFLGSFIQVFTGFWMVKRLIDVSYVKQLGALALPSAALAVFAIFLYTGLPFINYDNAFTLSLSITTVVAIGGLAYVSLIFGFWHIIGRPEGLEKIVFRTLTQLRTNP